jgi:tungstate transport system substrate-binding protein
LTKTIQAVLLVLLLSIAGLVNAGEPTNRILKLATTTSTENSGLLAELIPMFEKQSGYSVHVIAVGTGKALRMGRDGDVDVVLVHAPAAEKAFVENGYGVERHPVMVNDFIILGPESDPAGLKQAASAADALAKIAASHSIFISRGDDSGTHKKEKGLWSAAGIKPEGDWYREAGQGMGRVIQMAGELEAYTLADRGTWLASMEKSPLTIALEGDAVLHNPYGIIAVSPARYPDINNAGAEALIAWMRSEVGQKAIGDFRIVGQQLFMPSALPEHARASGEPQ